MSPGSCVYILASGRHGTIYFGVTSDLQRRVAQHRDETFGGFTTEYNVKRLVWYEQHPTIESAIGREKQIKKWRREWKINRIETDNPHWQDIAVGLFGFAPLPAAIIRPFRVPEDSGG